jgi:signal transduction histidine kinase
MTGMNYNYARPQEEIKISAEYSLTLYRVVQEALTNIAKYSTAKNVEISLEKTSDSVCLGVSDDGVGFDYDAYLDQPARRKDDKMKLGLQGLRERIELLGGKMIVGAEPGRGTRIDVVLFI